MTKIDDQEYLLTRQYNNASRLNARINLHARFSVNPINWFHWLFDHYHFPPKAHILELGCGPGDQWRENRHRIDEDWSIMLSDFSIGMIKQARENLEMISNISSFQIIDAQSIPFPDKTYDFVIANFMLYHVPNIRQALSEINRVLKDKGCFYTATVGKRHLTELPEIVLGFDPGFCSEAFGQADKFSLNSGYTQLTAVFPQVKITRYKDALRITEVEPLVDYIYSSPRWDISEEQRQSFTDYIQSNMTENDGVINITKDTGLFTALKVQQV